MSGKNPQSERFQRFIIITGLSGSGMSSATNAFEDLGYFCVDNLPVTMLPTFARLLLVNSKEAASIEKAALVIDIRERYFLSRFPDELKKLEEKDIKPYLLFFEASDRVLQRRFSETRRPHPADKGAGLLEAIRMEKKAMRKVRKKVDLVIDTSEHTVHTLRQLLVKRFGTLKEGVTLRVQLVSFGHKHGGLRDVDLLFDVRHLPNPYFINELRDLSGVDPKVIGFLKNEKEVTETIKRFNDLLEYLLPLYKQEGKSYLTIGIGCTGGRHRSVVVTNMIGDFLTETGFDVSLTHRDVEK